MDHAFISYASEERAVANEVCSTLEGAGLTCWIAPRDIPPSQDYGGAISEAIEKSRVVILLVSADSNRSPQVRREIAQAADLNRPIIPYRIQNIELSLSLKYYLSGIQWLDALPAADPKRHDALIAAVRKVLADASPPAREPAPEPTRPPEITPSGRGKLPRWLLAMAALFVAVLGVVLLWVKLVAPKMSAPPSPPHAESPPAASEPRSTEPAVPHTLRFKPGCPLPFAAIAVEREISYRCGVSGGDREPSGTASNLAKNNFCAAPPAKVLTFGDFKDLQDKVEEAKSHLAANGSRRAR